MNELSTEGSSLKSWVPGLFLARHGDSCHELEPIVDGIGTVAVTLAEMGQVGGGGPGNRRFGGYSTGSSQPAYSGTSPLVAAKNVSWSFFVTGPRPPPPTRRSSISRIGQTSAAVPVKNASSAV